jgi:hypothetical protein
MSGDLADPQYLSERVECLHARVMQVVGRPCSLSTRELMALKLGVTTDPALPVDDSHGASLSVPHVSAIAPSPSPSLPPPVLAVAVSAATHHEDEETKRLREEMQSWLVTHADMLPGRAKEYAALLLMDGVGSVAKLSRKYQHSPSFLARLGIDPFEVLEIENGLERTGLLLQRVGSGDVRSDSRSSTDRISTGALLPRGNDLSRRDVHLKVTGCGSKECNGIYVPHDEGEYMGCLWWVNRETLVQLWHYGEWRMGSRNSYFYVGSRSEEDFLSGWELCTSIRKKRGAQLPGPHIEPYDVFAEELSESQVRHWRSGELPRGNEKTKRVSLRVTECGAEQCNGIYRPHPDGGVYMDCLWWVNENGVQLWWNTKWRMGSLNSYFYTGSVDPDNYLTQWRLCSGFRKVSGVLPPFPRIELHSPE